MPLGDIGMQVGDIDMFLGDIDMRACSQPYCHKGFQTPHKYISIHKYYIIYRLNFFMKNHFWEIKMRKCIFLYF